MQRSFLTWTVHEMSGCYLRLNGRWYPAAVWMSAKNCKRCMNVLDLKEGPCAARTVRRIHESCVK